MNLNIRPFFVVMGTLAFVLNGTMACRSIIGSEPDLELLYASHASAPHTPVIVIPGILGSRLRDPISSEEVWPGNTLDLLTGRRLWQLELSTSSSFATRIGDRLVPGDFFFEAFGRDYYGTILATLNGPGGYHCIPASELENLRDTEVDCVMLAWDWRRDIVEAAGTLADVIHRLRTLRKDPSLRVDLVAHSAGGLVARYFLRFGATDVLDREDPETTMNATAGNSVRRAILIGTPNYGSVSALQGMIMGNRVGLVSMPPELLATMPSVFELLPNPNRTWMIDIHGHRIDVDLYDVNTWRRYRWSIFDPKVRKRILSEASDPSEAGALLEERERFFEAALTRGRRFHQALSLPLETASTEYVIFGGDCDLTPARCLLEKVGNRVVIRLDPDEIRQRIPGIDYETLMLEPGDGRVTKASLLGRDSLSPDASQPGFFPIAYVTFICKSHADLPSDITFRDNLLNILLY